VDGNLAHTGNVEFEGCEYCRLRGRGKFKLHPDSLYLYFKDGRLRCQQTLIMYIRIVGEDLYRILDFLIGCLTILIYQLGSSSFSFYCCVYVFII